VHLIVERQATIMTLLAGMLFIAAAALRIERFLIEEPRTNTTRMGLALRMSQRLASDLADLTLRAIIFGGVVVLLILVSYFLSAVLLYHYSDELPWQYLPERWPRRALIELLWPFVVGLGFQVMISRGRLLETVERYLAFSASTLAYRAGWGK